MPIEFDNSNVDVGGVDDRRGGGSGMAIGGGTGIVGLLIGLLIYFLNGSTSGLAVTPVNNAGSGQQQESSQELSARCNTAGALNQYTDCRLIKVYNINNDVWGRYFAAQHLEFSKPALAFFENQTQTGCGAASADVGPFYCPADRTIYFELGFLDVLQQKFGASGQFAQAYIVSHEYGHHLQTLLGIEPKVRALQERYPKQANQYSIAMELQADCIAGAWATQANQLPDNGIKLNQGNIDEAMNAAAAVGDDRIQATVTGRVNPEGWTHGSSEQRQQWFNTGYKSGDLNSCNTFKFYGLTK